MTLVGATTENPYFEVNSALLSRARIYELHAARARRGPGAPARARSPAGSAARAATVEDEALEFLAARTDGDARAALSALELACASAAPRRAGHARAGRGRAAAPGAALRQGRRPALRLHLGLDQVHARLGPGRVALLPRGDARGRRGPALHRPADGDPRLRGRRQRRPAGARASRSRPRTRSSTSACPSASSRSPRRRSTSSLAPKSDAAKRAIGAARGHTSASTAPSRRPPTCAPRPTRAPRSSGRGQGYDYPHDQPGPRLGRRSVLPAGLEDVRFYEPDERRGRAAPSAWRRSGGPAGVDGPPERSRQSVADRRERSRMSSAETRSAVARRDDPRPPCESRHSSPPTDADRGASASCLHEVLDLGTPQARRSARARRRCTVGGADGRRTPMVDDPQPLAARLQDARWTCPAAALPPSRRAGDGVALAAATGRRERAGSAPADRPRRPTHEPDTLRADSSDCRRLASLGARVPRTGRSAAGRRCADRRAPRRTAWPATRPARRGAPAPRARSRRERCARSTPPPASCSAGPRRSRPADVQGVVAEVAQVQPFWAPLPLADRGALPAPRGPGDPRRARRPARPDRPRAGQAAHRGLT